MTKLRIAIAATAALLPLLYGCSEPERFTLRYAFEPGKKLTYTHEASRSYQLTAGDSIIDSGSGQYTMTIITEVVRTINDSTAEIAEEHHWFETRKDSLDSNKIDSIPRERHLTMRSMSNGRISDIQFSADENVVQTVWMQNVAEQGTPVFPAVNLGIGDNWIQSSRIKVGDSEQEASTTYRVTGFTHEGNYRCAVVQYGGNMILPVVENPSDSARRSGIDRVTTEGTLYFAPEKGILIRQKEHWTISGDRQKLNNGEFMKYSVSVTMDLDTRLTEASQAAGSATQ